VGGTVSGVVGAVGGIGHIGHIGIHLGTKWERRGVRSGLASAMFRRSRLKLLNWFSLRIERFTVLPPDDVMK
tara:strand:+ start:327 stop:542 length:216 start_codon:yes stop_codon:yes gene_type:complete